MPYAVLAPGIKTVYDSWSDVERIATLYSHPLYRKFNTRELCWEYVRRHAYSKVYADVNKYGDTFNKLCVGMKYFIRKDAVFYIFDTSKFGYIVVEEDTNVEVINQNGQIKAALHDITLNDDLISNHLIAIWHGLKIIGEFVDIDITVPDHSIFYTLMTYKGTNRQINRVRTYINERLGHVSVTLKNFYDGACN